MKNILLKLLFLILAVGFFSCAEKEEEQQGNSVEQQDVAYSPNKDSEIQQYNLEKQMKLAGERMPCDTLSLKEFVLNNYPAGTYLVDFDRTLTFNVPKPAVIYYKNDPKYLFTVIATSKVGERLIETKNIIGYEQSFIDLDSTKLGTAFFYLTLFRCDGENFSTIWEAPIPSHGGFNKISIESWREKNIPYIKVNFHFAQGIGHIDYNYFLIDGLLSKPHLLMTYKGINFQRSMANLNNDKFPDYYEYIFYDLGNRVYSVDSVGFLWKEKDSLYVNVRYPRQTRRY